MTQVKILNTKSGEWNWFSVAAPPSRCERFAGRTLSLAVLETWLRPDMTDEYMAFVEHVIETRSSVVERICKIGGSRVVLG